LRATDLGAAELIIPVAEEEFDDIIRDIIYVCSIQCLIFI
jgi:hypothetical protein